MEASDDDEEELTFPSRPPFQLRSLPVRYRWEVTRRNPLYVLFWRVALAHHRKESLENAEFNDYREPAAGILYGIGVSGEPLDPSLEFDDLVDDQLNPAWLSGAVHPVSFKGLAGMLLTFLEPGVCGELAELLHEVAIGGEEARMPAITRLMQLAQPSLNEGPPEPFVSINPAASGRDISASIESLLAQWKADRGLSQQRIRSDKFDAYLEVWDLREGWSKGIYERTNELTLSQIASRLGRPVSTVANQYRQAFQLIVGQPYRPALWLSLFDVVKLGELTTAVETRIRQRQKEARQPRAVPETALGDFTTRQGPVSGMPSSSGEEGVRTLWLDIRELLRRGRTDDEIGGELELPADLIAVIRNRIDDGLEPALEK